MQSPVMALQELCAKAVGSGILLMAVACGDSPAAPDAALVPAKPAPPSARSGELEGHAPDPDFESAEPLTDSQIADVYTRAIDPDATDVIDPSQLCIRRLSGSASYVRVGRPERRGGCKFTAVLFGVEFEGAKGDFGRFDARAMAELGWAQADDSRRRELLLRWLADAKYGLAPGNGPFLVQETTVEPRISAPEIVEIEGFFEARYWTRSIWHQRDAPDDYYWKYEKRHTRFRAEDGAAIGGTKKEEFRRSMNAPPSWAQDAP